MLFYQRHKKLGVKGWELRKTIGSDYPQVLSILNTYLKPLDLKVKTLFEKEKYIEKPTSQQLDRARFFITLRGELKAKEIKMLGWRIDDLAGLAVSIIYILAKKGKVPRKELEEILHNKLPEWKVGFNIERYIRYGYLTQDDNEQLYLDWRTRTEVDQKALIDLLLLTDISKI